jgi:16S rRNA (uracil1498-N3)-methyltransferase
MQFSYDSQAGSDSLNIKDEVYKYLIKARRHRVDEIIPFRNLNDNFIYSYKILSISKRDAFLQLVSKEEKIVENSNNLHLIWCMVDPKTIEKYIASLNELGVSKITFVYCEYSQKNFSINIEKLNKILINSSCQCGRSSLMNLDVKDTIEDLIDEDTYFLDFSKTLLDDKKTQIKKLVVGCEGGFSSFEREKFNKDKTVGFDTNLILRSETAIISASSKILI